MTAERPELAFYYPDPMWRSGDWIKSLILYFDGVALLIPSYMAGLPERVDPAIAAGLEDTGLLHVLEPESFLDQAAAELLADQMTNLLTAGALDSMAGQRVRYAELSMSRLGYSVDRGLARMVIEELQRRGLAETTQDGVSVPMHPMVRSLVLVLLAQILRPTGRRHGLELLPTTDNHTIHDALVELLNLPKLPSAGHIVALDLEQVGIELGSVPLDEVLDFREKHGEQYRAYARNVRRTVRELGLLSEEQRADELRDRKEELADAAAALRATAESAWRRPAWYFSLAAAGAAWAIKAGDPTSAALNFGANLAGSPGIGQPDLGAFSYLFAAHKRFGGRG